MQTGQSFRLQQHASGLTLRPLSQIDGLGVALKALRKAAGLTQEQLAKAAQVSPAQVHRYEAGIRRPQLESLDRLMAALGVNLHGLADAIDAAAGRQAAPRTGRIVDRWKTHLLQEGIDRRGVWSLASGAMVGENARAAEDLVATVVAAAEEIATSVVAKQSERIGELIEYEANKPVIGDAIHEAATRRAQKRKKH
jgi:transcriptional regulator with XRE-family HTH domain